MSQSHCQKTLSDFFSCNRPISKRPVISEGASSSSSSSGSCGGSLKTPYSCPGAIPKDESLVEEAESESPEPESQAKDFAYACKQAQNVLFWKIYC